MDSPPPIEIFRPGTFTDMHGQTHSFSRADLAAAAAAYDPAVDQAPIVIGHPQLDTPAYGWIDRLEMDGDRLVAVPVDVEPAFAEAVRTKRYKKISASWYPPASGANPKPGSLYLKHVGFFGAHPVAVKGLRHASFSQDQADESFTIPQPDNLETKEIPMAEPTDRTAEFAERETALDTRNSTLDAREAAIDARERTAKEEAKAALHAANLSFAEGLSAAGKLAPAGKDLIVNLMDGLATLEVQSFGEANGELAPIDAFKRLFDSAHPIISFAELAPADRKDAVVSVSFAAPAGFTVDQASLETHNKAVAYQASHPNVAYIDAVKAVS